VCRCLYCNLTYILSGTSLWMELLDCMDNLFSVFWGASILFSFVVVLIYIPTSSVWGFFSPHPHQHLMLFVFLVVALLTGVRWNLNMVLVSFSIMTRDVEHFFMCWWPFRFHPLEKLCSVHLFISSLGHWFGDACFLSSLYILVINPLSAAGKDFLPFCELSLQSGDHFFCCEGDF
jgi:hypothetical protein